MKKTFSEKFRFLARNIYCKDIFPILRQYCKGDVLDVGGRDFYLLVKGKGYAYKTWSILENTKEHLIKSEESNLKCFLGDGCQMPFSDSQFDTILNFQVLEHVFEPEKMIQDIQRVLKPLGHAIFLIPQTGVLHELPAHYYNFTRFWIEKVMEKNDFEVISIKPVGGVWATMASYLIHFFFQSMRAKGMSSPVFKRNFIFYLLYPFMVIFALLGIPVCLLLSLGDLTEGANNHLVIVRKKENNSKNDSV